MTRAAGQMKRKAWRDPSTPKRVVIHPELHRILRERSLDGGSVQARVHEILCLGLKRPDLIGEPLAVAR